MITLSLSLSLSLSMFSFNASIVKSSLPIQRGEREEVLWACVCERESSAMQSFSILLAALLLVIQLSAITAFEGERDRGATWSRVVHQTIVTPTSSWCIADSTVDDSTLQAALDYACGQTTADCNSIKFGAPCFFPNTVFHHASYVFNSYYQMNAKGASTCSFGGIAKVTTVNPSNGMCEFPSGGSLSESTKVVENDGTKLVPHGVHILVIMCLLMQVAQGNLMGW